MDVLTLMNVLKVEMAVPRLVQTLLEAIHVPVTQAIAWQVICKHVMVGTLAKYAQVLLVEIFFQFLDCEKGVFMC